MEIYISKKGDAVKAAVKVLLLIIVTAAVFILAPIGIHAMSLTALPDKPDADTQVSLEWSSVPGAQSYQLFSINSTGSAITLAAINVNTTLNPLAYTDTGLLPLTSYTYSIKAYSGTGQELDQGSSTVSTRKIISPYNIKTVYNVNTKEVTLRWNASKYAVSSVIAKSYTNNSHIDTPVSTTTSAVILESSTSIIRYSLKSVGADLQMSDPDNESVSVLPVPAPAILAIPTPGGVIVVVDDLDSLPPFSLERSKWNGTSWDSWVVCNALFLGYFADNPPSTGKYRYRLNSRDMGLTNSYSGNSNITDSVSVMAPPSNLALSIAGPKTINLSWVNDPGTDADIVVLRKIGNSAYYYINTLDGTATSYSDVLSVITPGTVYSYQILAVDSVLNYTTPAEASISATIPEAPTSLRASVVSSSGITLNWTDNSNNESSFRIERMTNPGTFTEIATSAANTVTFDDTTVSNGQTYIYRVRAYNAIGNSAYSNEVTVSGWNSAAAASLTVTPVSSTRLDLSWGYTGTESYNTIIERKTGTDGTWSVIYTTAIGVLKYSDTGLSPNTRYFYRIRKSMGSGSSGIPYPNNEIGIGAYTYLGNLVLTGTAAANNTTYLTWTGNTGTADVIIERKMSNGAFSPLTTVGYTTTGWYDSTGLVPGASYSYRIKAKTMTNESVYSNEVTVKNLYLDAPSQLTVTVSSGTSVELNWNDNSTDETGFEIWRYIVGSGTYTLYATVDKNITTYIDRSIQKGVQYSYMVRGYVAAGALYSPYSNAASIGYGLINPPANLNYTYVSNTQVLLKWTDTSDNESGFKVEYKTGADGSWSVLAWLNPDITAYTANNLNAFTKYYFRIRAYNTSGNSDSVSNELLVSTAVPAAPSDVVATPLSASQIKITWKDNSDSEDGFRILWKPANSYYYESIAEVGKNITVFTAGNLTAGMKYSYKVAAYNVTGSSESNAAEAKTNTKGTFTDLGKSASWAKDAIENLAGLGIMKGVTATKYMPDNTVSKAEFTAMVVRAFKLDTSPIGSLADVKSNKWYYNEVMIAENLGIITGDDKNKFYPEKAITREEIATILFKVMDYTGKQITVHSNSVLEKFTDKDRISPDALASVATVVGEGILEGLPGNAIGPQKTATRAQAAVLLYRAMNK